MICVVNVSVSCGCGNGRDVRVLGRVDQKARGLETHGAEEGRGAAVGVGGAGEGTSRNVEVVVRAGKISSRARTSRLRDFLTTQWTRL